jgi:hypothetical protein
VLPAGVLDQGLSEGQNWGHFHLTELQLGQRHEDLELGHVVCVPELKKHLRIALGCTGAEIEHFLNFAMHSLHIRAKAMVMATPNILNLVLISSMNKGMS